MRTLVDRPRSELPQPVAQVGDPAQRPLRAGPLDDEVAGEAAVRPAAACLAVRVGRRRVGVGLPDVAQSGRTTAEQRADDLSPLAGTGGLLDQPECRGVAAGQPRDQPTALAAGRAVHRTEQAELGVGAAGDGTVVDHALVEVGPPGRARQRAVAAHPGQHPRLELGHVCDHEGPAVVGNRGRADLHGEGQRSTAVGRPAPGRRAGRLIGRAEATVAHPLVDPGPAVGREEVGELLVGQERGDARVLQRPQ